MSLFIVNARRQGEFVVKHSRFIAILAPCSDSEELKGFLNELANEHPQAAHIAYAFRLLTPEGLRERAYDAGEPSGTAGRPILQHLQGRQVISACLAVVRYFGGIKLGTGGLARAYGQAARCVLESATLEPYIAYHALEIEIDYSRLPFLNHLANAIGAKVAAVEYGPKVKARVHVPQSQIEAVRQLLRLDAA